MAETAPPLLLGRRVRLTWPDDGSLTDATGIVVRLSPCKAYPECWPLAEWCGYGVKAWERVPPVISADVCWDAYFSSWDLGLVMLPERLVQTTWVEDARWLVDEHGDPVHVPPLIENVHVEGALL